MAEFVDKLQQREDEGGEQQPLRRQETVGESGTETLPVHDGEAKPRADHGEPQDGADGGDQQPGDGQGAAEERIRVPKGDPKGNRVANALEGPPAPQPAAPLLQLPSIGRDVGLEQVGGMQLRQKRDHLGLARRLIAEPFHELRPEFGYSPFPIHQTDEGIGSRGEAVVATRKVILDHVPGATLVAVAMHRDMGTEPRAQVRHAVPVRTEIGLDRHGRGCVTAASPTG
ncbi:MAG: hypothetical protein RML45_11700 [Acetobacteraceae bacterium]|nr:hypothetical protein [Acetobacteraceae bacterium]